MSASDRLAPPVPAIVIAAGASSRMGGHAKALIEIDGRAAIDAVVATLRAGGADPILVVLGCHSAEIRAKAALPGVRVVEHAGWSAGRTSSIQAGLAQLPADAPAVLLALVDMPYVAPATIEALLHAHAAAADGVEILLPRQGGRRGHPILIRRAAFARIAALGPDEPLSNLVRSATVAVVDVPDPAIHVDLDTPEDVRRARGG